MNYSEKQRECATNSGIRKQRARKETGGGKFAGKTAVPKFSPECVCMYGLPLVAIHRPLQGPNNLGPVFSVFPPPPTLSQRSPYESVQNCGPAPLASPAHAQMHLGTTYLESDMDMHAYDND